MHGFRRKRIRDDNRERQAGCVAAHGVGLPDRGPDANGWYNHGLNVGFSGSDGVSGISSCSSGSYSGPD